MKIFQGEPPFRKVLYAVILLLTLPALLINLGMLAFIDDEGIRSLVALEMKLSGNYITPTLLGEFYYNKPPLYNWILICFYNLTGTINEWTTRMPTVFFLLSYAATVYYFFKKHFDTKFAFIMAFILITVGRIFLYDSMLGLIDICYSWVIFSMFMVIYDRWRVRNYNQLFAFAYFLASIGYLLKGLPTFIFLGTTLLALFIWKKEFKKLFSLAHLKGILIFAVIVGGYYLAYLQFNSLDDLFPKLIKQSTRRTAVEHGWFPTIQNLFTFHFEQAYHFLPWSLLGIYLIQKNIYKKLIANDFLAFCLLTFAVNIPLYWSSPEIYPRYLLMFPALLYGPLLYLHFQNQGWQKRVLEIVVLIIASAVVIASFSLYFLPETQDADYLILKVLFLSISTATVTGFLFKRKKERFLFLIMLLLLFRIGFNWFVLPDRLKNDRGSQVRISAIELGEKTKDLPLVVEDRTEMEWAPGFYITNARGKIVPRQKDNAPYLEDVLYIADPLKIEVEIDKKYELICRHREPKMRVVGTVKPNKELSKKEE